MVRRNSGYIGEKTEYGVETAYNSYTSSNKGIHDTFDQHKQAVNGGWDFGPELAYWGVAPDTALPIGYRSEIPLGTYFTDSQTRTRNTYSVWAGHNAYVTFFGRGLQNLPTVDSNGVPVLYYDIIQTGGTSTLSTKGGNFNFGGSGDYEQGIAFASDTSSGGYGGATNTSYQLTGARLTAPNQTYEINGVEYETYYFQLAIGSKPDNDFKFIIRVYDPDGIVDFESDEFEFIPTTFDIKIYNSHDPATASDSPVNELPQSGGIYNMDEGQQFRIKISASPIESGHKLWITSGLDPNNTPQVDMWDPATAGTGEVEAGPTFTNALNYATRAIIDTNVFYNHSAGGFNYLAGEATIYGTSGGSCGVYLTGTMKTDFTTETLEYLTVTAQYVKTNTVYNYFFSNPNQALSTYPPDVTLTSSVNDTSQALTGSIFATSNNIIDEGDAVNFSVFLNGYGSSSDPTNAGNDITYQVVGGTGYLEGHIVVESGTIDIVNNQGSFSLLANKYDTTDSYIIPSSKYYNLLGNNYLKYNHGEVWDNPNFNSKHLLVSHASDLGYDCNNNYWTTAGHIGVYNIVTSNVYEIDRFYQLWPAGCGTGVGINTNNHWGKKFAIGSDHIAVLAPDMEDSANRVRGGVFTYQYDTFTGIATNTTELSAMHTHNNNYPSAFSAAYTTGDVAVHPTNHYVAASKMEYPGYGGYGGFVDVWEITDPGTSSAALTWRNNLQTPTYVNNYQSGGKTNQRYGYKLEFVNNSTGYDKLWVSSPGHMLQTSGYVFYQGGRLFHCYPGVSGGYYYGNWFDLSSVQYAGYTQANYPNNFIQTYPGLAAQYSSFGADMLWDEPYLFVTQSDLGNTFNSIPCAVWRFTVQAAQPSSFSSGLSDAKLIGFKNTNKRYGKSITRGAGNDLWVESNDGAYRIDITRDWDENDIFEEFIPFNFGFNDWRTVLGTATQIGPNDNAPKSKIWVADKQTENFQLAYSAGYQEAQPSRDFNVELRADFITDPALRLLDTSSTITINDTETSAGPRPLGEDISTDFYEISSRFIANSVTSDYTGAYDVSEVRVSNTGSGRIYMGIKVTAGTTYYNDISVAGVQVLSSDQSTLLYSWIFNSTASQGWDTINQQLGGSSTVGFPITPASAANLSYSALGTTSGVGRWSLTSSTGSSYTGTADGISSTYSTTIAPLGNSAISQSSGTYYAYRETSGSLRYSGTVMRSPIINLSGGEYIRVIHLMVGYSGSQMNPDDSLYIGFI